MSEPKAQLVDPQGNMNLPGMNATGVITASSFSGVGGVVTGLTGSPNLNVGVVTATSFVGDGTGHAANLTGTPNLNLGLTTATSFIGDATGKAAGLTGTPNLNVGLITATSFAGAVTGDVTGNITGLAASITPGNNLNVGVATGIKWYGDGSNLTGAGSSAYIAQEVIASGAETIIDLSDGNLIYYQSPVATTVGFASTSAAEQITFIRDVGIGTVLVPFNNTFSSGGVVMDGTGDYLSLASSSDLAFGTGDFTMEGWFYWNNKDTGGNGSEQMLFDYRTSGQGAYPLIWKNSSDEIGYYANSAIRITGAAIVNSVWYHIAASRQSGTTRLFINGVSQGSFADTIDYQANTFQIGALDPSWLGNYMFNGIVSNVRLVKGTGLYTEEFIPPSAALTNITNTKLLCCQSTSSTTTAAVTPGTITANGDPTAGSQSINVTGTNTVKNGANTITWPSTVKWTGGSAPTLVNNFRSIAFQIFHLTTGDTGASYQGWEEMKNDSDALVLFGAGKDEWGVKGDNLSINRSSPTQMAGGKLGWVLSDNGNNYATLSSLFTKTDGTLWSWGYNNGNLGHNNTTWISSPTQVGADTNWKVGSQSLGKYTSGAVKTDGTLWVWGSSADGSLGINIQPAQRSSPMQLGTDTNWSSAVGGFEMFGALKSTGELFLWGNNDSGNLGQNDKTRRSSPIQVPGTTWSKITIGKQMLQAIKTDGTLWTWGSNADGSMGHNNTTEYSSPKQVGTDTTWRSVSASYRSKILATKTDGSLWSWGSNNDGSMGQNIGAGGGTPAPAKGNRSSPTQIPGTWSAAVANSGNTSGAVKADGTLWTWGDGSYGQGGRNNQTQISSPAQVGTDTNWTGIDAGDAYFIFAK